MQRRPRSPDEPVIAPALGVRLGVAGLLIAIGTLVVVAWGEDRYGLAGRHDDGADHDLAAPHRRRPRVARPLPQRLHPRHVRQRPLQPADAGGARRSRSWPRRSTGCNRIFDTVELDGDQWRACLIAVVGYLVLAELGKFILRLDQSARDGDLMRSRTFTDACRRGGREPAAGALESDRTPRLDNLNPVEDE